MFLSLYTRWTLPSNILWSELGLEIVSSRMEFHLPNYLWLFSALLMIWQNRLFIPHRPVLHELLLHVAFTLLDQNKMILDSKSIVISMFDNWNRKMFQSCCDYSSLGLFGFSIHTIETLQRYLFIKNCYFEFKNMKIYQVGNHNCYGKCNWVRIV